MSEGMNVFRLHGKKQSKWFRIGLPILLGAMIMFSVAGYADMMMEPLAEVEMEFVVLTLFVIISAVFILMEGIYKASGLLFNCRDDDLMLSLPVMMYAMRVEVGASFYLVSLTALLILPILPIVISSLLGGAIAFLSSRFKYKNLVQIVLTTAFLLVIMYVSINMKDILQTLAQNAGSINEIITKLYFPAGQFIQLVLDFRIVDFLVFVGVNVGILALMLVVLGNVYYKINSRVRMVKTNTVLHDYVIKKHRPLVALVRK